MTNLLLQAEEHIRLLQDGTPQGKHIQTADIRALSARLWRDIKDKQSADIFSLCEELLAKRSWALGVIAFDWAYRARKGYDNRTYAIFFHWLKEYVRGWGDCDDFCTHAFGELFRRQKELFPEITAWTKDKDFWVRRASAVVLIPAILHDGYGCAQPFLISDALMADGHDLVQKGCGWMLKCLSLRYLDEVKEYLICNCFQMPRTTFRYALEKLDPLTRKTLMSQKRQ